MGSRDRAAAAADPETRSRDQVSVRHASCRTAVPVLIRSFQAEVWNRLNDIAAIFEYEADADGNSKVEAWEGR